MSDNRQPVLTFRQIKDDSVPRVHGEGIMKTKDIVCRIECNDGESLSIQGNDGAYCSPRSHYGPYYELEVGFPSVKPPESMMEFCEDSDKPTDTVYGYVPVAVIQEFIDLHGGEKAASLAGVEVRA